MRRRSLHDYDPAVVNSGLPDPRPMVTDELIEELSVRFQLDRTTKWRDLGGSRSVNLLVRGGHDDALVVRIHRWSTTAERLDAEQEVRRLLAEAGVPTVVALATRRLRSGHLVELERYVPSDGRMNTCERLLTGFAHLARLHEVLRRSELPEATRMTVAANHIGLHAAAAATRRGAERIRGWSLPRLAAFTDRAVNLIEAVTEAERHWDMNRIEQVVHGDFWDNNVPFLGARLQAILDFGFMAQRLRVDDLALPFWFYLLEPQRRVPGEAERRFLRALLDSYDRAAGRPLSFPERMSLPLVVARQPAWSVGGWIVQLDDESARHHALDVATELEVAEAIWRDVRLWQEALV